MHRLAVLIAGEAIYKTHQRGSVIGTNQNSTRFFAGDENRSRHDVEIRELPYVLLKYFDLTHFIERFNVADDNRGTCHVDCCDNLLGLVTIETFRLAIPTSTRRIFLVGWSQAFQSALAIDVRTGYVNCADYRSGRNVGSNE